MELLIHGTKQGYKSNFRPNAKPSFALGDIDILNGVNDENPLGNSVYSLAFVNGGCVFTKYIIIRDTLRYYSIGYIAFSLFLPSNKELLLKGADVKSLLDKLSRSYTDEFVRDNNINRGERTLIQEDWSFVDEILKEFTEGVKNVKVEEIISGTINPAFHYYQSNNELIELFDKPYQEEYNDYKQILFVDSNLKGEKDPLKVLKHSGVELNPDLKNETYFLNNYNLPGLSIIANGKPRSGKNGENRIRAKWRVVIKYSKDNRCYEQIIADGTIYDLSSGNVQYLEIKDNLVMLKHAAFSDPKKKEELVSFEIKNPIGKFIEGAEIKIGNRAWEKVTKSITTINFQGEEIISQWKIAAKIESENLFSYPISVTPFNQSGLVELTLQKQKTQNGPSSGKTYKIDAGEHGKKAENCPVYSNSISGDDLDRNCIIVQEGYVFKNWQLDNNILFAQYEKRLYFYKNPTFIAGSVVGTLVLGFGLWAWFHSAQETATTAQQSTVNVEGATISLDTLNKIDEILKPKESAKDKTTQESKEEEIEDDKKTAIDNKNVAKKVDSSAAQKNVVSTIKTEIIDYINGSELDEKKLKEYQDTKAINQNLKNSIQLCLDFWDLKPSNNSKTSKTYCTLLETVAKDVNFKNSKLKTFLDKMCAMESPSYSTQDKKQGLKSI